MRLVRAGSVLLPATELSFVNTGARFAYKLIGNSPAFSICDVIKGTAFRNVSKAPNRALWVGLDFFP